MFLLIANRPILPQFYHTNINCFAFRTITRKRSPTTGLKLLPLVPRVLSQIYPVNSAEIGRRTTAQTGHKSLACGSDQRRHTTRTWNETDRIESREETNNKHTSEKDCGSILTTSPASLLSTGYSRSPHHLPLTNDKRSFCHH